MEFLGIEKNELELEDYSNFKRKKWKIVFQKPEFQPFVHRFAPYLSPTDPTKMIKSMTGYGAALVEENDLQVRAEVKSLNSKTLDLNVRLPRQLQDKEFELRNLVSKYLDRGKVLLSVELEYAGKAATASNLNADLLHFHFEKIRTETEKFSVPVDASAILQSVLRLPEVISPTNGKENREHEWNQTFSACEKALKACDEFRITEGKALAAKVESYITGIRLRLEEIAVLDPERTANVRQRIEEKLGLIKGDSSFDPNRFEQEMIFYLEKMDITEEKIRLSNHLDHFLSVLNHEENAGRKLGFISQEIGREINTIGSKANHAPIQKLVVLMKDELEKIKEQGLNFL